MTFIKFDIGEFFPRFGNHFFHQRLMIKDIARMKRIKFYQRTCLRFMRYEIDIFRLAINSFYFFFRVTKMLRDFGAIKFYLSRGLAWITRRNRLTGNENWRKLPASIFHDFSGASDQVMNEIESVPWWSRPRKCLRVTLAI